MLVCLNQRIQKRRHPPTRSKFYELTGRLDGAVLRTIVDRLAEETGQSDLRNLFSVAESLHGNLYNNWKTSEMVRSNVEDSKRLLAMLGIVYDNGG